MSVLGTRSESSPPLSATLRSVIASPAFFFIASTFAYALVTIAAVLTLNPYFSQTWDVMTFIQAARRFTDGGNPFDLYAASRASQTWPYAYPPLHALVVAIALVVQSVVGILPDHVWARVPPILADIAIALALYKIVFRKSKDERLARAAMLIWLFNPVTFYDTAVQGHFESEWLLFVLLAYAWYEDQRNIILISAALAIAFLFKQVAILFVIPVWVALGMSHLPLRAVQGLRGAHPERSGAESKDRATKQSPHWREEIASQKPLAMTIGIFALLVGVVCLPFLLYSNDFLYMNLTYVENVPLQTQSWLVGVLALTRETREAMTSDFFLLRYSTIVTMLAATAITFFAARRGMGLYLTATLIALAFFLTSKKVMGYYYVMLFPFLLAEYLPQRRFDLALIAIVATTWISLSPYFAPWANPDHVWLYALLGTINSALFAWLFLKIGTRTSADERGKVELPLALFISLGLFASAALATFLQPFTPNAGSPIRAPILAVGQEATTLAAFGVLAVLIVATLVIISRVCGTERIPRAAWAIVLIFAPLFFVVYTLTKESTAVFEMLLKSVGS